MDFMSQPSRVQEVTKVSQVPSTTISFVHSLSSSHQTCITSHRSKYSIYAPVLVQPRLELLHSGLQGGYNKR